jgi:hypothetical protein
MDYLGINPAKYVQEIYSENYKTLMKEIEGFPLNGEKLAGI